MKGVFLLERDEAVLYIVNLKIKEMVKEERESVLLDWWTVDETVTEYSSLPRLLQDELTYYEAPRKDVMNVFYDPLIRIALQRDFIGVKNEYLSKCISIISGDVQKVYGIQESLFKCPCCQYRTIASKGEYEICKVCFWEDDGNSYPNVYSSVNRMTLEQGQKKFSEIGIVDEKYRKHVEYNRFDKYSE